MSRNATCPPGHLVLVCTLFACLAAPAALRGDETSASPMRLRIERFATDRGLVRRQQDLPGDAAASAAVRGFLEKSLADLESAPFASFDQEGKVDYLLLRAHLRHEQRELDLEAQRQKEMAPLLAFAAPLVQLEASRRKMEPQDGTRSAAVLTAASAALAATRKELDAAIAANKGPGKVIGRRAARAVDEVRRTLGEWHEFYAGYDPEATWWLRDPFSRLEKELNEYAKLLRQRVAGIVEGQDEPVIGDPIGREALLAELESELIPYTPEELIEIANREFAWCEEEMRRAATDLGFAGDWKKALAHVSEKHLKPGEQPKLIRDLALEAIQFLEERSLVTIPQLCKDGWRMDMMSAERQKVNPYFTGGEVISISFPTDAMSHEDKLMSLRGNNPSFCRATVHHELIPGHHLQGFMAQRHRTHRRLFRTAFLVEGWALYWEMRLWDLAFARSAEDRVGMLFWRAHRCARIIFSLGFHLGKMSPDEAIDFLVDRVGHERRNATAEVRRSFAGSYGPLYQAAYLLGGLQLRALHRELVPAGKMSERDFHDAVLRENAIPIELIRASLTGAPLEPDFRASWRFYDLGQRPRETVGSGRRGRVYGDRVEPRWLPGGKRFWYRVERRGGASEFIFVDAEKGTRAPAFDHERVAAALSKALGAEIKAGDLPVDGIEDGEAPASLQLRARGKTWRLDGATGELAEAAAPGPAAVAAGERYPAPQTPRPSRERGTETEIRFRNATAEEVSLFWLDTEQNRQPYGKLAPGEQRAQHTFTRHVWLVARGPDVLGVVEAAAERGEAVVEDGRVWVSRREMAESRRGGGGGGRRRGPMPAVERSPDGRWEAFVKEHNLHLRNVESKEEHQLTTDATAADTYVRDVVRERAIGMSYDLPDPPATLPEVIWAPSGKRFVALRTHTAPERRVELVESAPRDQLQPRLISYPYLKPGDEIPVSKPHLFDIEAKREIAIGDALFPNPWDIGRWRWAADSSAFSFLYNQRGHQVLRFIEVDATSGAARAVIDEQAKTFICYSQKLFLEPVRDTDDIVWMSERDGWNHLYLYDGKTGAVKNQITRGEWAVRQVEDVDVEKRQVWFTAGGIRPGQDPYHVHLCRVGLDGSGLTILTEGDGTHETRLSPDRTLIIDRWSRVDLPPVTELRRADDGKLVCRLEEADAGELRDSGWRPPERFAAKGRDGATDIYGIIHFPRGFDPSRKYAVIESIYAGPHDSHVPKSFRPAYGQQAIADLGFVVVQIDGMGTSNRSKAFHDVCWKNIADAGFPDRIAWMQAAARERPYMDLTRVGVYGGSAGGQNALGAVLLHGDFYKAAAADCGCHDNRMDKIWWNEQWMGWPVGPHYEEQSNVTLAPRLQGKLLLTVGELDKNVDPASTMQVARALVRAGKDFELVVIPGGGHGSGESEHGRRKRAELFTRALRAE